MHLNFKDGLKNRFTRTYKFYYFEDSLDSKMSKLAELFTRISYMNIKPSKIIFASVPDTNSTCKFIKILRLAFNTNINILHTNVGVFWEVNTLTEKIFSPSPLYAFHANNNNMINRN